MVRNLFTIGYEGLTIDAFVSILKTHAVDCILDVREVPLSRKRGFSKTALQRRLADEEMTYVHLRELGSPKEVRNRLRQTNDYKTYFAAMDEHLSAVTGVIERVYELSQSRTCCLMCFEKHPQTCHRSMVASRVKETDDNGLRVRDL